MKETPWWCQPERRSFSAITPPSFPLWTPVPHGIGIIIGITAPGAAGTMPGITDPGITTPGIMKPGIGEIPGTCVTATAIITKATAISIPGFTAAGIGIPGTMTPGIGEAVTTIIIPTISMDGVAITADIIPGAATCRRTTAVKA